MAITRRALLISNPGEIGDEYYCAGVNVDMREYKRFLKEPHGGLWSDTEVVHLDRPNAGAVSIEVRKLEAYDYSFIAFSGHGYHSQQSRKTVLVLRKGVVFPSDQLHIGATKRTIVLDCCREVAPDVRRMVEEKRAFAAVAREISPVRCRQTFDEMVERASEALVVIHSCSIRETAGDSQADGGYYTACLIDGADTWKERQASDRSKRDSSVLSIVGAHDYAVPCTQQKNSRQNPVIEKPRTVRGFFPFAVFA